MTVRSISIEAYHKHIESGKQLTQWQEIYRYLRECTFYDKYPTRSELSDELGMRMSSVCGRVNELLNANLIFENERRKCTITKEPAHTLGARKIWDIPMEEDKP